MILDTTAGTCILGSNFDKLITMYRDSEHEDYPHCTVGKLWHHADWLLLNVDDEITRYYASIIKQRFSIDLHWKSKWGAHVSVIRGEALPNPEKWGRDEGREIKIYYTHQVYTNADHWWVNVISEELADIRTSYGLPPEKKFFHLTVGRTL
ncbi:hypothetical protein [Acinetobacter sp.]|uniref:hypothetical protein n=1 Tax=Acinetobacter sp. TaxID=472 RepID=UPI00388FA2EC